MDDKDLTPLLDSFEGMPGATLPILQAVQARFGHVPSQFVPAIAAAARCSAAEIRGCLAFYADFTELPRGSHRVQLCRAEACLAVGAAALVTHAENHLGIPLGSTTADGRVSLEAVYCLGNCAAAPSIRIDDAVHALVDADGFDRLVDALDGDG